MQIEIKGHILTADEFTDRDIFTFTGAMDMACGIRMSKIWMPQINQALRQQFDTSVEIDLAEYRDRQSAERDLIFLLREIFGELPDGFISRSGQRLLLGTPEILQIWTAMAESLLPKDDPQDEVAQLRSRLAELEAIAATT